VSEALGIHLGARNVYAAVWADDRAHVIRWGANGFGQRLPAVVGRTENGAIQVGRGGLSASEPGQVREAHPLLDQLDGDQAHQIINALLSAAAPGVELADGEIDRLVLSVPSDWSTSRRHALRDKLRAQVDANIDVLDELTAVTASVVDARGGARETVLACHFGQTTSCAALVEVAPGRWIRQIDGSVQTVPLSGYELDSRLFEDLQRRGGEPKITSSVEDVHHLRELARRRELISDAIARLAESGVERVQPESIRVNALTHQLDWETMEQSLSRPAEAAMRSIAAFVARQAPSCAVAAGGLARMRVVRQSLADATGLPLRSPEGFGGSPELWSAIGCARVGGGDVPVEPRLPCPVGLVVKSYGDKTRDELVVVLSAGVALPARTASPIRTQVIKEASDTIPARIGLELPGASGLVAAYSPLRFDRNLPVGTIIEMSLSVDRDLIATLESRALIDGATCSARAQARLAELCARNL
jgi:molecular chaperone DnaK (HSP70)